MKTFLRIFTFVAITALLASCAAGPNEQIDIPSAQGIVAGFWRGLWHGLIAPIAFIISLFTSNVQVYEVHNNGAWYNFGYLTGAMMTLGGGGHGASRSRKSS